MTSRLLCHLDELEDPGSRGFFVRGPQGPSQIFLVRQGQQVYAYLNSCPHTGGPLDWLPDQFLDLEKKTIQCATHDARFQINDGYCLRGPCAGQKLKTIEIWQQGQQIYLLDQRYVLADRVERTTDGE